MADVFSRSKRSEMMSRIRSHSPLFPFPRMREIPRSGNNVACRRMRLSPQRFLPTQEWKRRAGMRDIADCLTLRRLRGGVKIRASEFLGGGGMPPIIVISPPPATASRSHPPPQAAEGKNSFFVKKRIPIPAKAGISPTSNCLPASHSKNS